MGLFQHRVFNRFTKNSQFYIPSSLPPSVPSIVPALYRTNSSQLFTDVVASSNAQRITGIMSIPARGSVANPKDDYLLAMFGPSYTHVESYGNMPSWAWVNLGGDWSGADGVSQGSTPHAVFTANSVTSGSASYVTDITAGVQQAKKRGRWNAYIAMTSASTRSIAAIMNASRPTISVIYVDGTVGTLACTACVAMPSGTSYTQLGDAEALVGSDATQHVAIEFEMPAKYVDTAALNITLTQHTATPCNVSLFLANPPFNKVAATDGLAAAYPGDVGIKANPAVLFAQNYADGTTLADYIFTPAETAGLNIFASSAWDQSLWGGASDTTKLPTAYNGTVIAGQHKWIQKQDCSANISLVSSSYTGDGFVPYAPGLGALRIVIPASSVADGGITGGVGSLGCDLVAPFPKAIAGIVREVFIRFPVRIATANSAVATTKMYRDSGGASAGYAIPKGKWGVGAQHWTYFAGNGGYKGNQRSGWTNRMGFEEVPTEAPLGGRVPFMHSYDNFADGHNLGIGLDGLGSSLYPNRWYEFEIRLYLNSYNVATGVGASDGIIQVWIDRRLCVTHTGVKYRDGLIDYIDTPNGPNFAPFRELGCWGLMLNEFVGGHLPADHDIVTFYGPIVAATQRIG